MLIFKIEKEEIKLKELASFIIKLMKPIIDLDGDEKDSVIFIQNGNMKINNITETNPGKTINTREACQIEIYSGSNDPKCLYNKLFLLENKSFYLLN